MCSQFCNKNGYFDALKRFFLINIFFSTVYFLPSQQTRANIMLQENMILTHGSINYMTAILGGIGEAVTSSIHPM